MTQNDGFSGKESSLGRAGTDPTQFFFPNQIVGIFYGSRWHEVKEGTFKDGIDTADHGEMSVYMDPFSEEIIFLTEHISGFKIKKPEPPPEPQATVTPLFPE